MCFALMVWIEFALDRSIRPNPLRNFYPEPEPPGPDQVRVVETRASLACSLAPSLALALALAIAM